MTPRQRSVLVVAAALAMTLTGLALGALAIVGPDNGGEGLGQYVASNDASDASDTSDLDLADLAGAAEKGPLGADLGPLEGDDLETGAVAESDGEADDADRPTLPLASDVTVATTAPTAAEPEETTTTTTTSSTSEPPPSEPPASESTAALEMELPSSTSSETTTTTQAPASGQLSAVEQEIARLTNELRANPSGPLARQKPLPNCVSNDFYRIEIDGQSGHPEPAPALTVSQDVSLAMSRPWAAEMDRRDSLEHRSSSSALGIYGNLGIGVEATGENIAWFSGYPDSQAARIHFEGWRESDSGHYCALISPRYTHVGVGHHKGSRKSWGVQNFYRGG